MNLFLCYVCPGFQLIFYQILCFNFFFKFANLPRTIELGACVLPPMGSLTCSDPFCWSKNAMLFDFSSMILSICPIPSFLLLQSRFLSSTLEISLHSLSFNTIFLENSLIIINYKIKPTRDLLIYPSLYFVLFFSSYYHGKAAPHS